MARVLVLFAHPRLEKSRANRSLLRHLPQIDGLTFRDVYEHYPDFNIAVAAEQALLLAHDIIVWHHPLYWYNTPPLVKQWIDMVLSFGWAYGPGGDALRGKAIFHVLTTGGAEAAYQLDGFHGSTLGQFLLPLERTMRLCGMDWLPPFTVHGTHVMTEAELDRHGALYHRLLKGLVAGSLRPDELHGHATLNAALGGLPLEGARE
jgi:glutathione-regulated potassium-efflux system ancillary protein KefG